MEGDVLLLESQKFAVGGDLGLGDPFAAAAVAVLGFVLVEELAGVAVGPHDAQAAQDGGVVGGFVGFEEDEVADGDAFDVGRGGERASEGEGDGDRDNQGGQAPGAAAVGARGAGAARRKSGWTGFRCPGQSRVRA